MSSFWNFLFAAILIILWIIAGGYVTQANIKLSSFSSRDSNLNTAYWYTFWAAFVTWTLIAIFIILIILSVVGVVALFGSGAGEAEVAAGAAEAETESTLARAQRLTSQYDQTNVSSGISWFTIIFLIFALILILITGVLSAIAASSIASSSNYNSSVTDLVTAYNDCIIAASISLGAAGLLILGAIIYFVVGYEREQALQAHIKAVNEEHQKELNEIRILRQRAYPQQFEQDPTELPSEIPEMTQPAQIQPLIQDQITDTQAQQRQQYQQPQQPQQTQQYQQKQQRELSPSRVSNFSQPTLSDSNTITKPRPRQISPTPRTLMGSQNIQQQTNNLRSVERTNNLRSSERTNNLTSSERTNNLRPVEQTNNLRSSERTNNLRSSEQTNNLRSSEQTNNLRSSEQLPTRRTSNLRPRPGEQTSTLRQRPGQQQQQVPIRQRPRSSSTGSLTGRSSTRSLTSAPSNYSVRRKSPTLSQQLARSSRAALSLESEL